MHMLDTEVHEGEILQNRLSPEDLASLAAAIQGLEHQSLAMRLATVLGKPVELFIRANRGPVSDAIFGLTQAALRASLHLALSPNIPAMRDERHTHSSSERSPRHGTLLCPRSSKVTEMRCPGGIRT